MTGPPSGPRSALWARVRRAARPAFILYTAGVFTLTHWPDPDFLTGPHMPSDKVAHAGAFALWAFLLLSTGWLGAPGRPLTALRGLGLLALWAALDEWTQSLPFITRHTEFWDYAADCAGGLLGTGVWLGVSRWAVGGPPVMGASASE